MELLSGMEKECLQLHLSGMNRTSHLSRFDPVYYRSKEDRNY